MWMAPNMVTLLGFMWIVANVFLIEICVPDMVGPVSPPLNPYNIYWGGELTRVSTGPRLDLLQFRPWHVDVSIQMRLRRMSDFNLTSTRYSTLDNVDGKQARRTGTSSGLGELFEFVPPVDKPWTPH